MFLESRRYQISHRTALVRKPLTSSSLRILHLSDIHFRGDDSGLGVFFEELGRETFDFIFISGDILTARRAPRGRPIPEIKITERHLCGFFGNHDYYNYGLLDLPPPLYSRARKAA